MRFRAEWSRPGLLVLLEVLRDLGVVGEEPVVEVSGSELLVASFAGYLRSERGLAEGTTSTRCGMTASYRRR